MRAETGSSSAYSVTLESSAFASVSPQAGLFSIAYRLAALSVPRLGVLVTLSAIFYLF